MQSGTSPWEAAGLLGRSLEMLLERYGHHHLDLLSGARKAFAKHHEAVANAAAGISQEMAGAAGLEPATPLSRTLRRYTIHQRNQFLRGQSVALDTICSRGFIGR
jgi:hypothetical protein